MSSPPTKILSFPNADQMALSIRAKAQVFNDPRSLLLLDLIEKVAACDASVLIIGETGTGKELVARHIHEKSGRSGPFVAVNCGAFSETLVESELFGHESGAFTGAQQARSGWFEAANGGTLFLDEVGDLSLPIQVKLLRVLQERQVTRIGSRKPTPLDVRLIAATNVELEKAVAAGHFRLDLYYRLNVAPFHLPPLRERRGDIMPLVHHFIDIYRRKLGLGEITLTAAAEQALLSYPWPGNIRELENALHFALILCRNATIDLTDLRLPNAFPVATTQNSADARGSAFGSELERLEYSLLQLLREDTGSLFETVERLLVTTAFRYPRKSNSPSGTLQTRVLSSFTVSFSFPMSSRSLSRASSALPFLHRITRSSA